MKQNQKPNRPAFEVLVVEGDGDKVHWTKIGAAWQHEDGEGYNITLSAHPIGNKLVLRVPKGKDDRDGAR